jgi:eukaryotic-like serine/threonine-protein kinase
MTDDRDVTQSFQVVEDEPAPPPAGPPPGAWLDDVWPWLAVLAGLAVAAFLVWFFVFRDRGTSHHVVPAVVGLQQQAAISKLTGEGYAVKAFLVASQKPQGIVAAQSPGGGSQLPKGSTVTIHVSNGRTPPTTVTTATTVTATATTATTTTAPTTTVAAPNAQVPDVTGEDLPTATGDVEAAGFVPDTQPVDSGGPAGTVAQQNPSGGGQAPAGSAVTLDIVLPANRPGVQVPNVVGKSAADARAALAQAKLTFTTGYKSGKAGVVLAQSVTGTAPAYTQVGLTVGR